MRRFTYSRPGDVRSAVHAAVQPSAAYLAGGTTLLDLMKLDVRQPSQVIDIGGLEASPALESGPQGLRIHAFARMSEVAEHEIVRSHYPVLRESLLLAASQQIRHMARIGGNLLQSTRCSYFRDTGFEACNRRGPGSGCAAIEGNNRGHAVLGGSDHCFATYPGDLGQALIALDAVLEVRSMAGVRSLPLADLHRLPGTTPQIEHNLAPGELIIAIHVPAGAWTRRSAYLKYATAHLSRSRSPAPRLRWIWRASA